MSTPEPDVQAAFAELVRANRARAVSLAWRLCGGDGDAAEDIAQEAFERAHRGLARFRSQASLQTWFYRILVRQAYNHRRRGRARQWLGLAEADPPDPRPAPARDIGLQRRIASALDKLSRGQREAFVLVHLEGFTVEEAAATLGKAPGTIKSHLHRALAALRTDLADLHTPERKEGGA